WARKTSDGLVGNARKDGVNAAQAIELYLQTLENPPRGNIEQIESFIRSRNRRIVDKFDLNGLLVAENKIAAERGLESFKFSSNEEMLSIIEHNRISIDHTK
ncbi:MAG TPA: hypothetical protein VK856_00935, partial [Anaerolineaceae bacterium]|nr:hypothetical protein [Anaerolineaceae bacterium]